MSRFRIPSESEYSAAVEREAREDFERAKRLAEIYESRDLRAALSQIRREREQREKKSRFGL